MSLTKSNRIKRIDRDYLVSELADGLSMSDEKVGKFVDSFINQITQHLIDGESISLTHEGLGRFDVVNAAPRKGRNVVTGETLLIPARLKVKFVPAMGLKHIKGKKE